MRVGSRSRAGSIRPPTARCGSWGTSTTARQRAAKYAWMRPASTSALTRSWFRTTTASAASRAWPWAHNQSSVFAARPAPSTVGEPTTTRPSATVSVPAIAECTRPVPESVTVRSKYRPSSALTRSYSSRPNTSAGSCSEATTCSRPARLV